MSATISPIWFTARAAGTGALLLASLSVSLGLIMTSASLRRSLARFELRAVHEALALGTLALLAVHGLALLSDPVLKAGVAGILIPFASPYRAAGVAAGQIAGYGLAGLGLTYYLRGRLGPARWRKAHRVIPAFWALGVIHGLTVGSDAGSWWFLAALLPPLLVALSLLAARYLSEPEAAGRAAASA